MGHDDIDAGSGTTARRMGHDEIIAGAGNDNVFGGMGHDEIIAGTGDDFVDGGYDDDTSRAVREMIRLKGAMARIRFFDGVQDDFTFAVASDGTRRLRIHAALGTDVISGVETLRFNDGDLTVTRPGTAM